MHRAVFMDRDGTICEEVGYLDSVDRFRIFPWTAPAILKLNQVGLRAVLVTNQSGVARGYFSEDLVRQVHEKLQSDLKSAGARLDAIYYCPHHPEASIISYRQQCDCRKPGIGMLEKAAREFDLDLATSFVIGDRYLDLEMAFRAGACAILVLSGYGQGEYVGQRDRWPRQPDHVASNLLEAINWILSEGRAF